MHDRQGPAVIVKDFAARICIAHFNGSPQGHLPNVATVGLGDAFEPDAAIDHGRSIHGDLRIHYGGVFEDGRRVARSKGIVAWPAIGKAIHGHEDIVASGQSKVEAQADGGGPAVEAVPRNETGRWRERGPATV
jgi:hypothetical protein